MKRYETLESRCDEACYARQFVAINHWGTADDYAAILLHAAVDTSCDNCDPQGGHHITVAEAEICIKRIFEAGTRKKS